MLQTPVGNRAADGPKQTRKGVSEGHERCLRHKDTETHVLDGFKAPVRRQTIVSGELRRQRVLTTQVLCRFLPNLQISQIFSEILPNLPTALRRHVQHAFGGIDKKLHPALRFRVRHCPHSFIYLICPKYPQDLHDADGNTELVFVTDGHELTATPSSQSDNVSMVDTKHTWQEDSFLSHMLEGGDGNGDAKFYADTEYNRIYDALDPTTPPLSTGDSSNRTAEKQWTRFFQASLDSTECPLPVDGIEVVLTTLLLCPHPLLRPPVAESVPIECSSR